MSISFLHCRKLTALYWLSFSLRTKSSMRWQRSSTALMAGRTPSGAQPWSTSWGRVRTRCWGSYKRSSMRPSGIRRLIVTSGSSSLMTSFRKTWPDSYGLGQRYFFFLKKLIIMISWIKIWVCCCKYINEIEFQHPPPNLHSPPPPKKNVYYL